MVVSTTQPAVVCYPTDPAINGPTHCTAQTSAAASGAAKAARRPSPPTQHAAAGALHLVKSALLRASRRHMQMQTSLLKCFALLCSPENAASVRMNAARMPSSHLTWVCRSKTGPSNNRQEGTRHQPRTQSDILWCRLSIDAGMV